MSMGCGPDVVVGWDYWGGCGMSGVHGGFGFLGFHSLVLEGRSGAGPLASPMHPPLRAWYPHRLLSKHRA